MSAEAFFRFHKPGADFHLHLHQEWNDAPSWIKNASLVGLLGHSIANSAASGVRALEHVARKGGAVEGTPEAEAAKDADFMRDSAAVLFGASLQHVARAVVNGTFDVRSYLFDLNHYFTHTTVPTFHLNSDEPVEVISTNVLDQMREVVRHDQTLASLYKRSRQKLLPEQLFILLATFEVNGTSSLSAIREMLPEYEKLAQSIAVPRHYQSTEVPQVFEVCDLEAKPEREMVQVRSVKVGRGRVRWEKVK